jgi:hypothetical protein
LAKHSTADVLKNNVLPAIRNIQRSLRGLAIRSVVETSLRVAFFSLGSSAVLSSLLHLPVDLSLYVGAGASVAASLVKYRLDRKELLAANPYSYALGAKQELS